MTIDPNELIEDIEKGEAEAQTLKLDEVGLKAWQLDQQVKMMENDLASKKKELKAVMERELPEAMTATGLSEFGFETPTGTRARMMVETKVRGTINNAPDIEQAVYYLEITGFEGGVKTNVSIDLTEEERDGLDEIIDNINSATGKHPNVVRNINASTLASFGRQKLKEDPTWDYERVGLTAFTSAKFTAR